MASVMLPALSMSVGMTRSSAAMCGGTVPSTSRGTRASAAADTRGIMRFF